MRRPGYREAIRWMVDNDDTEWADRNNRVTAGGDPPSVTAALVADIFGVDPERVRKDIARGLERMPQ